MYHIIRTHDDKPIEIGVFRSSIKISKWMINRSFLIGQLDKSNNAAHKTGKNGGCSYIYRINRKEPGSVDFIHTHITGVLPQVTIKMMI